MVLELIAVDAREVPAQLGVAPHLLVEALDRRVHHGRAANRVVDRRFHLGLLGLVAGRGWEPTVSPYARTSR